MELFYCTHCNAVYLFNVFANKQIDSVSCRTCGRQGPTFLEVQIDQKIKLYMSQLEAKIKLLISEHRHQWDGMVVNLDQIRPFKGGKMTYAKFIEDLKNEFFAALNVKTNWGRNDIKREFEWATVKVLAKYLERTGEGISPKKDV